MESILSPIENVISNTGISKNEMNKIISYIQKSPNSNCGYDAKKRIIINDLVSAGIVDPTKVERVSLQNTGSGISTLITSEVIIAEE